MILKITNMRKCFPCLERVGLFLRSIYWHPTSCGMGKVLFPNHFQLSGHIIDIYLCFQEDPFSEVFFAILIPVQENAVDPLQKS